MTHDARNTDLSKLKIAVVHDWLPVYAGAEKVLEQILNVFPQADVFSLIEHLPDDQRSFLKGKKVKTSFIQSLPLSRRYYRYYLPLAPFAIEQFDLRGYDVVLSSSYVVAKAVLTTMDQVHISYVHSPVRYAWDLYFDYLENGGITSGLRSWFARLTLHYLRMFDASTASRVDYFLANSRYVSRRIAKTYRRESVVVYPPVNTSRFQVSETRDDYYLTLSRLVPYKRIDLIVRAFSLLPERKLIVIGDGPEMAKIRAEAGPNVQILGYQDDTSVQQHMERARAFVFAAEEDFGIVPVEAQSCGIPVIAFGAGGALETVVDGKTGVLFHEQTEESLAQAVEKFEQLSFDSDEIRHHAEAFSESVFCESLEARVAEMYADHHNRL